MAIHIFVSSLGGRGDGGIWVNADTLSRFNTLLAQLSPKSPQYASVKELDAALSGCNFTSFVTAFDRKKLVGMAAFTDTSSLTGRRLHIDDIVVDEEYRGHGVATMMLEMIESIARAAGYHALELTCQPYRKKANELYQRLGFELRETNPYRKKLE